MPDGENILNFMSGTRQVFHVESNEILLPAARWCDSFFSRLRGFMFRASLEPEEGLVLVEARDNRMNTSIHMLFVRMALGVIWVNNDGQVVDIVEAQPWRLSYKPQAAARYVIEGHPAITRQVKVGDHIQFSEA